MLTASRTLKKVKLHKAKYFNYYLLKIKAVPSL